MHIKVLFLSLTALSLLQDSEAASDPTLECILEFEDNGVCACSTQDQEGAVTCLLDKKSVHVDTCYCLYYDASFNMTILGHCFFTCLAYGNAIEVNGSEQFNSDACNIYFDLHRSGRFCGQCNKDYGLAAYSYQLIFCVPCENYGYMNWLLYFAVALLPLTLFYVLAVLLGFNATSTSLSRIILIMQCNTLPPLMSFIAEYCKLITPSYSILLKIFVSLICMANLDFFCLVYPTFCLHPEATVLEILSLDYIVALYPFFLIFLTYILLHAYDRRYRLLIWMWRPFKRCVAYYRNTWNIHTSLVEIFATFILLSSVKILGVSFQILSATSTYDLTGRNLGHRFQAWDSNIEYLGLRHLPFALLAIAISFIFVILPLLLLLLYHCRCFHVCLNCCG